MHIVLVKWQIAFLKFTGCDNQALVGLHGAFQKVLERYNNCIAAGGDYFEGG